MYFCALHIALMSLYVFLCFSCKAPWVFANVEEKCQGIRKKLEDLARIGAEVPSSVARVF